MVRLLIGLAVAAVVFIVYSVIDCATMPHDRVRGISKTSWIFAIILLPVIGGVLWFAIGRVKQPKGGRPSGAPDDDPEFLRKLDQDRAQSKRIHDLEDELRRLDDDGAGGAAPGRAPGGAPGKAPGKASGSEPGGAAAPGPDDAPGGASGAGGASPRKSGDTEAPDDGQGRKPPGTPNAS